MTTDQKIISILKDVFSTPENLSSESKLVDDLIFDSLDGVELVMLIEDDFNISIKDEDAEKWQTVGDVIKYVENAIC